MDGPYSYSDGGSGAFLALVVLIVTLAVFWLLVYSAVRVAVGDSIGKRRPRFVGVAATTTEGTRLTLTNAGDAPAFHVSFRWQDDTSLHVLGETLMLSAGDKAEFDLPVPETSDGYPRIRTMAVEWRDSPSRDDMRRKGECHVLMRLRSPALD
jgi:hypothetical protein